MKYPLTFGMRLPLFSVGSAHRPLFDPDLAGGMLLA